MQKSVFICKIHHLEHDQGVRKIMTNRHTAALNRGPATRSIVMFGVYYGTIMGNDWSIYKSDCGMLDTQSLAACSGITGGCEEAPVSVEVGAE